MSEWTFRSARGAGDAEALIAVHDACTTADGVDPRSVLEYRPTVGGYRDELARTDPADWVTPERRSQGIGTELLRRLEERCRQKAAAKGGLDRLEIAANASASERDSRRLLEANGYFVGYTVLEMRHGGEIPSAPPLPEGYDLRVPEPDHYRAIWQCIGDAYDAVDGSGRFREIADEGRYRRYFYSASADPPLWLVAWEQSRIAGQVLCRIENGCGEVYEVSVGLAHRRKGLARALLLRGLAALRQRGIDEIRLFTLQENPTQAWRLCESVGFTTVKIFPRWRKG